MSAVEGILEHKLGSLTLPLAVVLPGGSRIGPADAAVTVRLKELGPLAHIASGQVGKVGQDYVDGRLDIDGSMRDLMDIGAELMGADPTRPPAVPPPLAWVRELALVLRSRKRHRPETDAEQIQFHYDVSDDFYKLWLDPLRLYSCAYYASSEMTLAQAQEAKLDHICRKLMLQPGERFLDIGAGWGGLLMWAAEHYGVRGHGITLSRNQHAHVSRLIDERGLAGRVSVQLLDYRDLPESEPFDKIASVGMFEHVGRAQLPRYFDKIHRLLKPGGLLMNHGITAGGTQNDRLGAGLGDFIERNIFPGGELLHVSHVLRVMSEAALEPVDVESLRPHYARTLWAWSDALEARLDEAAKVTRPEVVRAYRLYLAGSAMCFERGWLSLHQMLGARRTGSVTDGPMRGAQSVFPFNRSYMYAPRRQGNP
ncbi:class I SAM-dependent methyltransferase [Piscinibacter koreensis]|uniref:Class I SAM-dependent methyltransferase n=1 Tax=Piscinibacter koreensis TaxID=2742824 RepID=A0A7Y6NKI8_9BURK|nr:class I SAM-dependent methyltransferase [Schlegelella koreensis]NUZ04857.1 class I SAM-dependent methyltransferase [Schlegelella koreensis]